MDFDREYNKPRRPGNEEDFTDQNVQALIEGRRSRPLPRPFVGYRLIEEARRLQEAKDRAATERHYDSRGYCDNPGRGY